MVTDGAKEDKMDVDEEAKKKEEEEKKPEPTEAILKNPSRVVKQQEEHMQYLRDDGHRYYPILDSRFSGFVVLQDVDSGSSKPEGEQEPEQFYDDEERDLEAPNPDLVSDLDIPKPFEFDPAIQNAP